MLAQEDDGEESEVGNVEEEGGSKGDVDAGLVEDCGGCVVGEGETSGEKTHDETAAEDERIEENGADLW